MSAITDIATSNLKKFLGFLLPTLRAQVIQFFKSAKGIAPRYLLSDFLSVLSSLGLFFFFQFFAFVLFTMVPQGKDVLFVVAEDVSKWDFIDMVWLLVGLTFWSVTAEYAARYAIYVTDNSARSLSDNRVVYRKALQKALARISLMWPFITMFSGLAIVYFENFGFTFKLDRMGFYVIAVLLYLIFNGITRFYFNKGKRREWMAKRESSSVFKLLLLPEREIKWSGKLYGLYNDYVFSLPKAENFKGAPKMEMEDFTKLIVEGNITMRYNFPQSDKYLHQEKRVPQQFRLMKFTDEPGHPEGQYRWIYNVPVTFYNALHRQLRTIFFICLTIFTVICAMGTNAYESIGAPALIVISFACWSGFYLAVLYIDYAKWKNFPVSLRFLIIAALLLSSRFNNDHPVRENNATSFIVRDSTVNVNDTRMGLQAHFATWIKNYKTDTTHRYRLTSNAPDSANYFYPVVFICAEGGASRTGAFAAEMLSIMQDSLKKIPFNFNQSIYAYSGVSGGSLGVSFFNAMNNLTDAGDLKEGSMLELSNTFFNKDFLAPLIGKMFYGDIINLFLPVEIPAFDRAATLEKSWEDGYSEILKPGKKNAFGEDNLSLYANKKNYPALFVNTTEVETGEQCWLSNVKADPNMLFANERDLLGYKLKAHINYSTMINFSTRFPLFSPAANVNTYDNLKFHYVDGGYVENTGCGTMLEVLKSLKPAMDKDSVKPFVIILRFNDDSNDTHADINWFNEVTEILLGIYNTRGGRTAAAVEELKRFINTEYQYPVTELKLEKSAGEVPLNWVLSTKSLDSIQADVKLKWNRRDSNSLHNLFFIDSAKYIKAGK